MSAQEVPDYETEDAGGLSGRNLKLTSAINLATRLGRDRVVNTLTRRLEGRGGSYDPTQGMQFDSYEEPFDSNQANRLRSLLSVDKKRRGDGPIRPGAFTGQLNIIRGENAQAYSKDYLDEQYNPNVDRGISFAQELMDKPAISAEAESIGRGRIMAQLKGTHEDNLRQAAATFGMNGLNPSSAAGSAVLARLSLDSDAELSRALSDNGLQVSDINRKSKMAASGMLTDLVTKRLQANLSINDPQRIMDLNSEVGGLMEALRVQTELRQYQAEQEREAQGRWRQQARYAAYAQGLSNLGSYFGAGSGASSVSAGGGSGSGSSSDQLYSGSESGYGSPTSSGNYGMSGDGMGGSFYGA